MDVLNGSGRTGAAATELKAPTAPGYTAGRTSNAATTIVYGPGAQAAAHQIAGRLHTAAPVAGASVPAGHERITLGADFTAPATGPAGSAGSPAQASPPSPVPSSAFAGDPVKMGGIPCVD